MNSTSFIVLGLVLFIPYRYSFAGERPTHRLSEKLAHKWEYITFTPTLPDRKDCPTFFVRSEINQSDESQGFRLDITHRLLEFFKTNVITAKLYRENGEIVEPTAARKQSMNFPIGLNGTMQMVTFFPWGTNALEACWINVSAGTEQYWLEIPYGFDRNLSDPLPPSIPGGCPRLLPAMKALSDHDHIIHWQNVHYDLGKIRHGRWLSLIQSNPVDAESEIELYDENEPSWNLYTPRTSVRILAADNEVHVGRCINLHLDDRGMRRSDTFNFGRSGSDGRSWGQIEISVDDKTYRVVVPSSLYEYIHGHVLPNRKSE